MNIPYQELIPADFHPASRVWMYQSSRIFTLAEALELEDMLNEFVGEWHSHGAKVKGYANLLYGQFVVIMADETQAGVSGCSTDSSVRLVKAIEQKFGVEMFNRQNLAFLINGKVQVLPLAQLKYAVDNGFINADTIYFNNLVATKHQLMHEWMVPVKQSWLAKKLGNLLATET